MVDALSHGLLLALTPGQQADSPHLPGLLDALPGSPGAVVAGKAYDTNHVLAAIARHAAVEPVIPPTANRLEQRPYDANLYAERNKVEHFFGRLKEASGYATR